MLLSNIPWALYETDTGRYIIAKQQDDLSFVTPEPDGDGYRVNRNFRALVSDPWVRKYKSLSAAKRRLQAMNWLFEGVA